MLIQFTSIIASVSLLSTVHAYGMIAQVVDANDFCVFLPPDDATDRIISDSEWDANAFCMGSTPLATGAGTLPSGFIRSAHYVKTDLYVQVTGQIDYTKANLDGTDGGGQMDIKAPVGSSCAGWKYYVNMIEPNTNTYCMRCCNDTVSCNRGISQKGCAHVIPGDYSGPNDGTGSAITSAEASSTVATTTTESASSIESTSTDAAVSSTTTETTASTSSTTIAEVSSTVPTVASIASSVPVVATSTPVSSTTVPASTSASAPSGEVSAQAVSGASISISAQPIAIIGACVLAATAMLV